MDHPGRWFWPGVWNMGILQAAVGRGISGIGHGFRVNWCAGGLSTGLSFCEAQTVS